MSASPYPGTFEQVVLLALASAEDEADGMTIVDRIQEATDRDVSVPAVYVTLKRLEKKGLVSSDVRIEEGSGPPARKVFRLEPDGIEALRRARTMLDSLWARVRVAGLMEGS